ncbi:MAG: response regulator [Elusimicrobiota bacterium]
MNRDILVAEEDALLRSVLKRALESRSYPVLCGSDEAETIRLSESRRAGLILLGIDMAKRNGWRVLRALRADIHAQMTPVVLVSQRTGGLEKIEGYELGADDYLAGPLDPGELLARVESILRRNETFLSANPLTRLPGGLMIESEVNRRIRGQRALAVLYIDIDHFKSFNDAYGYARGDRVIRETAAALLDSVRRAGSRDDLVGHVGGDDFVILTRPRRAERIAHEIIARFDSRSPSHYGPMDRAKGYVATRDRRGIERRFPLMTLSIAIATDERRSLDCYAKVADITAEIKRHLKSRKDHAASAFLMDRRTDGRPPRPPGPPRDRARARILVVDDDDATRAVLSSFLKAEGYDVSLAEDGRRALEMIRRDPRDLVLLDILMPELGGIGFLKAAKTIHPDLPVIMVTGIKDEKATRKVLELGACACVAKPFDLNDLRAHIRSRLALGQSAKG